jgi:hypothetical protein
MYIRFNFDNDNATGPIYSAQSQPYILDAWENTTIPLKTCIQIKHTVYNNVYMLELYTLFVDASDIKSMCIDIDQIIQTRVNIDDDYVKTLKIIFNTTHDTYIVDLFVHSTKTRFPIASSHIPGIQKCINKSTDSANVKFHYMHGYVVLYEMKEKTI